MKVQSSGKGRRRLLRQLRLAQHVLDEWSQRIRVAAVQASATTSPSGRASPGALLLTIVEQAKSSVDHRLAELHGIDGAPTRFAGATGSRAGSSRKHRSILDMCVDACRACGRSVGAAFREAQAAADAVSAKILYVTLRELERLLWILDPREAR